MTSGSSIDAVADALAVLRAEYPVLLDDIARGERVLWIGSGISRGQVPGVEPLLQKVFAYLRDQIDPSAAHDPHRKALEEVIRAHVPHIR